MSSKDLKKANDRSNLDIGKSYYSVLEVLKNKITSTIIENKDSVSLDLAQIEKIKHFVDSEIDSAKSWGYDHIKIK